MAKPVPGQNAGHQGDGRHHDGSFHLGSANGLRSANSACLPGLKLSTGRWYPITRVQTSPRWRFSCGIDVYKRQTLNWGEVSDLDVDGYLIRFHYGHNRNWDDASPLHTGVPVSYTHLDVYKRQAHAKCPDPVRRDRKTFIQGSDPFHSGRYRTDHAENDGEQTVRLDFRRGVGLCRRRL